MNQSDINLIKSKVLNRKYSQICIIMKINFSYYSHTINRRRVENTREEAEIRIEYPK